MIPKPNLKEWRTQQAARVERQQQQDEALRQQMENAPDPAQRIQQNFEDELRQDANLFRRKR